MTHTKKRWNIFKQILFIFAAIKRFCTQTKSCLNTNPVGPVCKVVKYRIMFLSRSTESYSHLCFISFPQFYKANARLVPWLRPWPLLSPSLPAEVIAEGYHLWGVMCLRRKLSVLDALEEVKVLTVPYLLHAHTSYKSLWSRWPFDLMICVSGC